jgi:hypothetical protein
VDWINVDYGRQVPVAISWSSWECDIELSGVLKFAEILREMKNN